MNPLDQKYESRKEMFKIFKEDLRNDAKNIGGDVKSHEIKYGKWKETNRT